VPAQSRPRRRPSVNPVPTYPLEVLAGAVPGRLQTPRDVFVLAQRIDGAGLSFGLPYRSEYYGVGMCFKGGASLSVDLEKHLLEPGTVLAMAPEDIKQWRHVSADFEHIAVFFTRASIAARQGVDLDRFSLFARGRPTFRITGAPAAPVKALLRQLQRQYARPHPYRDDILRASISVLLYELEALSQSERPTPPALRNRGWHLTAQFKQLVKRHFASNREVSYYARRLSITERHLSATLREQTGVTAGRWIQETVVLEARVLLQDRKLTIAQVADALHFPDQSAFGRYFKHIAGMSPLAYRGQTVSNPTF
jgi:AraC family transcriptional regulator, transcriptional activator of pobA